MVKTAGTTLEKVGVNNKSLDAYRVIVGDDVIDEIKLVSRNLRGVRLLHVNATASGGGVAELLNSLVPLEQDCGLRAMMWQCLRCLSSFHPTSVAPGLTSSRQPSTLYRRRIR